MLAYVDENGQISATPPDPLKKIVIKAEDIDIGVPKHEDEPIQQGERQGVISFFNEAKGYGFIKDVNSQESIFVHMTGLVDAVRENDKVTFEVEMGQKGPNAIGVKLIKK